MAFISRCLILICLLFPLLSTQGHALSFQKSWEHVSSQWNLLVTHSKSWVLPTPVFSMKINKDLFEEGVGFSSSHYGSYQAHFDSSRLVTMKYHVNGGQSLLQHKKKPIAMDGWLRLKGPSLQRSKFFLSMGLESEHQRSSHFLSTANSGKGEQSFLKTSLASGVGLEHKLSDSLSLSGEVRANLYEGIDQFSKDPTKPSLNKKAFLIGLHYKLPR